MILMELFKSYNVYTTNNKLNAVYKPYKNLVLYIIGQKTYYCKQLTDSKDSLMSGMI